MEYFAGLDISMEGTHVCVVDREGAVVHEQRMASTPEAIAASLAMAPACRRIVFELRCAAFIVGRQLRKNVGDRHLGELGAPVDVPQNLTPKCDIKHGRGEWLAKLMPQRLRINQVGRS
jgi:hypothetical protein